MRQNSVAEGVVDADIVFLSDRVEYCFTDGQIETEGITIEDTIDKLMKLPSETIDYLAKILRDEQFSADSDYALDRMLIAMLNHGTTIHDLEDVAFLLSSNEMVLEQSIDYFAWDTDSSIPTMLLVDVIKGLRSYKSVEGFAYDRNLPIRRQGQKVMSQCSALVEMADYLEVFHESPQIYGMTVVADWEMIDLVVGYPDLVHDIIREVSQHGDENIPMIRAIILGEVHRALGEGVL